MAIVAQASFALEHVNYLVRIGTASTPTVVCLRSLSCVYNADWALSLAKWLSPEDERKLGFEQDEDEETTGQDLHPRRLTKIEQKPKRIRQQRLYKPRVRKMTKMTKKPYDMIDLSDDKPEEAKREEETILAEDSLQVPEVDVIEKFSLFRLSMVYGE
ncbi:hypothetical protein R1flu_008660 [Riccia fluitans]|uniref:Uncharacterized protein n=1 Tax=Riccia fluitans TaxID=41844 RepID=A0ABD1YCJ6_9MARC